MSSHGVRSHLDAPPFRTAFDELVYPDGLGTSGQDPRLQRTNNYSDSVHPIAAAICCAALRLAAIVGVGDSAAQQHFSKHEAGVTLQQSREPCCCVLAIKPHGEEGLILTLNSVIFAITAFHPSCLSLGQSTTAEVVEHKGTLRNQPPANFVTSGATTTTFTNLKMKFLSTALLALTASLAAASPVQKREVGGVSAGPPQNSHFRFPLANSKPPPRSSSARVQTPRGTARTMSTRWTRATT